METPSIEQVKKHFENAKEVRCIASKNIIDISDRDLFDNRDIHYEMNSYWICKKTSFGNVMLWDENKFAEIISYKEKTYTLTEKFVKELCKEPNIKEAFIREGIIENDKLEVGNWYWYNDCLLNYKGTESNLMQAFGFYQDLEWGLDVCVGNEPKKWKLATPQEVETALINEAKKRGYINNGNIVNIKNIHDSEIWTLSGNLKLKYNNDILELWSDISQTKIDGYISNSRGFLPIFKNGTWAEIIDETIEIKKSVILKTPNDLELGQLIRKMV